MRMRVVRIIALPLLVLLPLGAHGQPADTPPHAEPHPQPAHHAKPRSKAQREEILVTAKRRTAVRTLHLDAAPQDLPIAVQSVPIEVIQDQGLVRLGDAVRDVSGVTRKEAYFGLTDSFNIRGFDASTGLFNGFRHDYYGQVTDLAHVESVDIIKGPASVTTGFLEPGGVVNVTTKRPTAYPLTEIDTSAGSFGRVRVQADVSRQIDDQLAIRVTGATERTDSYRDIVTSSRETIGAAVDWKPTAGTLVEVSSYYQNLNAIPDRGLPNDPISLVISPGRFFGEPSDTYRLQQFENSVILRQTLTEWLSLRTGYDSSRSADKRKNTQAIALQPDDRTFTRDYTVVPGSFDTMTAFAEGNAHFSTFGLTHKLTAGIDWTRQQQVYDFLDTDYDPDAVPPIDIFDPVYGLPRTAPVRSDGNFRGVTVDVGTYANDLISLGPVKLLLGVRHDSFSYGDHDIDYDTSTRFRQTATTPRVGIVYQPIPSVSLYSNYAESFNPQQFTRLANGAKPAPSQGKQEEVGLKYLSADGRYSGSVAAYQIHKTNIATPDPADPTGTFSILSGEERSRGLEFDLGAKPVPGLQTILALSYIDATVTRDAMLPIGDSLVNVPRTQATLWARYDIPGTKYGVGTSVFHVGRRQATLPNSFTIPAYTRWDLAFFWRATPKIEAAINLQNITDARYYDSQDNSLFPAHR